MSMQVMLSSSAVLLFMLLLVCCGSGGVVCAKEVESGSQSNSVELFKKGETKVSESATVAVTSFRAHSLIDVNGLMVAFAEANSSSGVGKSDIEIWSNLLKYENDKMLSEIIKPEGRDQQMTQAGVLKKAGEGHHTVLLGPSAVVKDNKIYILVSNYTRPKTASSGKGNAVVVDLELVVGTPGTSSGDSKNTITWQAPTSLKSKLMTALQADSWKGVFTTKGRGLLMGGSTIVFPIRAVMKGDTENSGKPFCTVIYSDDGVNWNFPSNKVIAEGCVLSTLFEQGGKLFMVTASQKSRTRKVYVSTDNGKQWTEYTEADSNLLIDFLKRAHVGDTSDVIPATINDRSVTLLTQRRFISSSEGSGSRHQVHLFVTDNKRITSVGPVFLDTDIGSVCKLLLTKKNGGLFALCEKGSLGSQSVVLLSLTEQLGRIKSVLNAWESTDGRVSSWCTAATKGAPCSTPPMPTTGLVGFLSDTGGGTHWADEYFGVNATVTGGTKVENGFKLSGPGAKVEWEVGSDFPTPRYSFADRGLTLVATVAIHEIPKSDTPLMRVGLRSKIVGLWYDKDGEWKGLRDDDEEEVNTYWEKDKPYQVAITLLRGAGSVYIDGERLGSLDLNFQPNNDGKTRRRQGLPGQPEGGMAHELHEEPRRICFGGCVSVHDGDENTAARDFTVTNVFLYNRVLNDTELAPPPPPQQQQQQEERQSTAKGTKGAGITGEPTVEKRSDNLPAGNNGAVNTSETRNKGSDSSAHVRLPGVFLLFALLAFLCSATLMS